MQYYKTAKYQLPQTFLLRDMALPKMAFSSKNALFLFKSAKKPFWKNHISKQKRLWNLIFCSFVVPISTTKPPNLSSIAAGTLEIWSLQVCSKTSCFEKTDLSLFWKRHISKQKRLSYMLFASFVVLNSTTKPPNLSSIAAGSLEIWSLQVGSKTAIWNKSEKSNFGNFGRGISRSRNVCRSCYQVVLQY